MNKTHSFLQSARIFADIGRAQGITVTASVAICGALTSTASVTWYHLVYFTLVSCFLHTALNTYIAKNDVQLDAKTYTPERNPVVTKKLSGKGAMRYVWWSSIAGFLLIIPFFVYQNYSLISVMAAFACALLAFLWLIWYGYKGKLYLMSYDFVFSVSYSFWVMFGVFAVNGMPTNYTWLYILATILATTAFAQWENGLKDVEADRAVGVKSFAVVSGVKSNNKLGLHRYMLYGIGLKSSFLAVCLLTFAESRRPEYLLFVLLYGVTSQLFILWRFGTLSKPVEHRRTILLDVALTGILVYSIIYPRAGFGWLVFLVLYLILGYLVGSTIQQKCEFKFRRFSQ